MKRINYESFVSVELMLISLKNTDILSISIYLVNSI